MKPLSKEAMPLYQCISPQGLIDDSQRENIAAEITRIHKRGSV